MSQGRCARVEKLQWRMTEKTMLPPQLRNLCRLVGLRAIEVAGQVGAIAIAVYGVGMALPTNILFSLTASLALATLFCLVGHRQPVGIRGDRS